MKIKRGKRSGLVVTLGRDETQTWKRATPDSYALRKRVLDAAERSVRDGGITGTVEVYASASDGGWKAAELRIEGGRLFES